MDQNEKLQHLRHTAAHLLAAAVRALYPDAQNAIGPAVESGFYQDFDLGDQKLSDEDLPKIEAKMRELLPSWHAFERSEVSADQAREEFSWNKYKTELIEEFAEGGKQLTFYTVGGFVDLCKGGHLEKPAEEFPADAFKLDRVAGAYWRGNEKNKMLTRIYGLAFASKEDLDAYLTQREEAEKRDHRKLGRELDLFTFSDLVGSGLPLFTPKGTILRSGLIDFSEGLQKKNGFQEVWIPHITKTDLYKKSGHWDKFGGELFLVKSQETDTEFVMKPMNCPHHTQIYASQPRSYRDLPIRYMETTTCYRDEKAGELAGLSRVRSLNQDDAHIFCRMDQIEDEFASIMGMIKELYGALGMNFRARLSFRDPAQAEKYLGDVDKWDSAQMIIEKIAKNLELDYEIAIGEAAFYGPKIDIMVLDALGREWQCATEQLDFVQPSRFGLEYTDTDGTKQTPVMIHKALLGSVERFLAVYIEHTAGAFPLWLAPVQVVVVPVSEKVNDYAQSVTSSLKEAGLRVEQASSDVTLGKNIRHYQEQKVPYMLIVGPKEAEVEAVSVRSRDKGDEGTLNLTDFSHRLSQEITAKS